MCVQKLSMEGKMDSLAKNRCGAETYDTLWDLVVVCNAREARARQRRRNRLERQGTQIKFVGGCPRCF